MPRLGNYAVLDKLAAEREQLVSKERGLAQGINQFDELREMVLVLIQLDMSESVEVQVTTDAATCVLAFRDVGSVVFLKETIKQHIVKKVRAMFNHRASDMDELLILLGAYEEPRR